MRTFAKTVYVYFERYPGMVCQRNVTQVISYAFRQRCVTRNFTTSAFKQAPSLTQNKVLEFVTSLNAEERQLLINAVKTIESEETKIDFKGTATFRWRSEFGRPSKITKIDENEPVVGECGIKSGEKTVKPTRAQLIRIGLYNAVPFVGFGFLDNTFMILGGDSIEMMLGSVITISTMTAAALGNTLSDVMGIGSAFYVERFAAKLGVKQPPLTPAQLTLRSSRFAANLGRTLGVTLGCILGMFPLLFK